MDNDKQKKKMSLEYNYCLGNTDALKKDVIGVQLLSELERIMYGKEIIGGFVNTPFIQLGMAVNRRQSVIENFLHLSKKEHTERPGEY